MQGMQFIDGVKTYRREQCIYQTRLNLGVTGAITTQTKRKLSGVAAARTGVGLYTFTFPFKNSELLWYDFKLISATAPAANGLDAFVTSDLSATTGVITVQFRRTDTGASAEIVDNAKVLCNFRFAQSNPGEYA